MENASTLAPAISGTCEPTGNPPAHTEDVPHTARERQSEGVTLAELATHARWVAWQTEGRGGEGKPTKVPYAPDGRKAKANDPATWGLRVAAEARAAKLPRPFGPGGVGLQLGDHDGLALGGIDLDACRDAETGTLAPWAAAVVERFASYVEVSPSGTGAKLFFRYDPADLPELRRLMGTEHGKVFKRAGEGDHPPAIELHLGNRYFAVTGQPLPGSPAELRQVDRAALGWLLTDHGPTFAGGDKAAREAARAAGAGEARAGEGEAARGRSTAGRGKGRDNSRSAAAYGMACRVKRQGQDYTAFLDALGSDPATAAWQREKGEREVRRTWDSAGQAVAAEPADDGPLTESSVAKRFAQEVAGRFLYCHTTGAWFEWGGTHWRRDGTHAAFTYARWLGVRLAANETDGTKVAAGRAAFCGGVERHAQRDRGLAVKGDAWDRDPFLLATPGGTVDLRTGKLRTAAPGDRITRTTAVAPSRQAPPDLWLSFLDQATGRDDGLIAFLQRWCGYCLTGDTREHAILFGYGPGGNGKSVFLNTVSRIMGDYAAVAAMDTFTVSHGDKHPTDMAMLRGARLVTATETEEGRPWAESRIKQLTGGDPVSARFMRQDFFTFRPAFKLTIVGNHKPVLRNVDDAARRRFNIVPFLHKPSPPDRELEAKLVAEWPAILAWMIDGCLSWQAGGLGQPDVVREATGEYFDAQDVFGQWAAERCIRDPSLAERPGKLLADFNGWAERNGEEGASRGRFRSWAERQAGLRYKTVKGSDYLQGIGLGVPRVPMGAQGNP